MGQIRDFFRSDFSTFLANLPQLESHPDPCLPPVTSLEILQTSGFLRLLLHDLEELLVVDLVVFVLDPGDQKVRDELFVETEQRVFPGGS